MKRRTSSKTKEGLSLIEVVMATFLVTLLGGAVVNGVITARRHTYLNAQRVEAFGLAKSKMEEMKGVGYATLSARYGSQQQEIGLEFVNLGGVDQNTITARRTTTLEDLNNPRRKRVRVRVEWEFQGIDADETLETFLYPRR